uniref:Xylulose kinase-1 n=1 Tax=Tanacetum cinerariifolium TaxID=118510 RepID=A0A6L2LAK1_TANCI|nr:hypothetical protein [Tanacetum cinerariifolium]
MSTPTFAKTHNLVAFLEKPAESAGFEQIIDFLKSKPIHYALTMSPTIYVFCVKQFWATAKVKKVNDQEQIQALVDKKKVIITEDSIRSNLRFDDTKGTVCLLNSTMAFAIICLAARHKEMYIISSHTKKIFDNMRRIGAGFSAKQNPKRKQRKEADVSNDESEDEDHVPTPSSDPLHSGEDSFILNELMVFLYQLTRTEIALDDETQGRINNDEMFRVDDLAGEEVVMDTTTGEHEEQIIEDVSTAELVTIVALAALKSIKPKVMVQEQEISTTIPAAGTIVTTVVPTPRAKGNFFHEKKQSQIPTICSSKDKGKAKIIELEIPIKKKDQMRIDEEYARRLEVEEQEAARLSRARLDEESNNSCDNIQAIMDADRLLAERLQVREREELSEVHTARLLVDMIEKRKKHFAALRAQEKRNKPPTKTQMKSQMSTYLKHMDESVEPVIDDTKELKKGIEIVPNDGDDVLIEATPLSSRSPTIIDYKIHKEGKKTYFKIIRPDGRFNLEELPLQGFQLKVLDPLTRLHLIHRTCLFSLPKRLNIDNTIRVNQIVTIFFIESSIRILDQNRYPVDTSLIHLESRKLPTVELFDVDSNLGIHMGFFYFLDVIQEETTLRLRWDPISIRIAPRMWSSSLSSVVYSGTTLSTIEGAEFEMTGLDKAFVLSTLGRTEDFGKGLIHLSHRWEHCQTEFQMWMLATMLFLGFDFGEKFKSFEKPLSDYCCSEWSHGDKIICDLDKTPDLSQRSPHNCPKCGNPVDGQYCQGCALLRKKFKEDLFTYCIENGILQDSFEPSNDNTNVANSLQEPFVVNQDPGKNSSQSPPQINHHCCYGCGDPLEDIFCHQCTCQLCGNNAHFGYNCLPKVSIIPDPEPFNNQTIKEWKWILKKQTKTKPKNNKTKHKVEKIRKDKVIRSRKSKVKA